MRYEEIEAVLDKLDAVFEGKGNMTGLEICEKARLTLHSKGELSQKQADWIKNQIKIHKIDVSGKDEEQSAEEINAMFDEVVGKLEEIKRQLGLKV